MSSRSHLGEACTVIAARSGRRRSNFTRASSLRNKCKFIDGPHLHRGLQVRHAAAFAVIAHRRGRVEAQIDLDPLLIEQLAADAVAIGLQKFAVVEKVRARAPGRRARCRSRDNPRTRSRRRPSRNSHSGSSLPSAMHPAPTHANSAAAHRRPWRRSLRGKAINRWSAFASRNGCWPRASARPCSVRRGLAKDIA